MTTSPSSLPRPAIAIAAFNAERYLPKALETMLSQSLEAAEIAVCDDASTDHTPEILADFASSNAGIRVIRNEESMGGYGAMNRAVRETRADYVAVYHADDVYHPTILEQEVAYLEAHPAAGAVLTLDWFIDADGHEYDRVRLPRRLQDVTSFDARTLTEAMLRSKCTFLRTPSVMFRRSAFDAVGGFDQEQFGISADVDLWLRLSLEYEIGLLHEYLYGYRHHSRQWSDAYSKLRTTPELFFAVLDKHLSRPGVRALVTREALTLYRIWQVKDETERAANILLLGDHTKAVALVNSSFVRPLLRSSRKWTVLRILALRSLVRLAAAVGGGRTARAAVYMARFRRWLPRRLAAQSGTAAQTLAAEPTEDDGHKRPSARPRLTVFLDPFSTHFYGDGIFDPAAKVNRDNFLSPWHHLHDRFRERGVEIHTADYLVDRTRRAEVNVYSSFGVLDHYRDLAKRPDVLLNAFYLFEVMVLAPEMYRAIPDLTQYFRSLYSWTDADHLAPFVSGPVTVKPFFMPMPRDTVIEPYWSRTDRNGIVLIAANKRAVVPQGELFTERLRAIRHFANHGGIHIWGRWWNERIMDLDEEFRDPVRRSYQGAAAEKYDVLSRYRFAVCYENMALRGWITEKIFDCFYAGTVPVYLGAPDITDHVSKDCFIDFEQFGTYDELSRFIDQLGPRELEAYREAGRDCLASEAFDPFKPKSFADRFIADIEAQLREHALEHVWP